MVKKLHQVLFPVVDILFHQQQKSTTLVLQIYVGEIYTIYLGNAQLSSIGQLLSGSFTGSFTGDASSITGVVSSSYALSSSHADRATFAVDTNALYTASITDDTISFLKGGGGTFQLTVDNVASSSFATTASYAESRERRC
jgi:hypothetical protein